jgi:predicted dehydrogenase
MTRYRWGILGPGRIARTFAQGLESVDDAVLYAVGARSQASAQAFADKFGVPTVYDSYEALASDPQVDVIYIATPHTFHKEHTLLCLEHGKAVLCEKPFAVNAAEATQMIEAARGKGVFLMEAMWSRFLPHIRKTLELIQEGAIGEVRQLSADFGFRTEVNPQGRLFDPKLGGGGLLDVGVYVVSLAHLLFGTPSEIVTLANLGETGIDEEAAMLLRHRGSQLSLLSCAVRLNTPQEAVIIGTAGTIRLPSAWWRPNQLILERQGQERDIIEVPYTGNGYNYQAMAVQNALAAQKLETDIMPLSESLAVMQTLDTIRAQWGLSYPTEDK